MFIFPLNMKKSACLLFLYFCSCTSGRHTPISVRVVDPHTVAFSHIDYNLLANLQRDTLTTDQWQRLLPVYRMPADTDMKDFSNPQPGKYRIKDSLVIFTPDTPLHKNTAYFARYYQYNNTGDAWKILKTKWKTRTPQYTECVFRP